MAALIMPPAFALIVRLFLYEPVLWSLRQKYIPKDAYKVDRSRIRARLKIVMVVAATVLVVEGIHFLIFGDFGKLEKPAVDTRITTIGVDSKSDARSPDRILEVPAGVKPILVELFQGRSGTECRIDGESLVVRPGQVDEVHQRVLFLKRTKLRRPVEIEVAPTVPVKRLVAVMDACVRVKVTLSEERQFDDFKDLWILVPSERPFSVIQQVRLVREEWWPERKQVRMQLPGSIAAESLLSEEVDWPTINVTYPLCQHSCRLN